MSYRITKQYTRGSQLPCAEFEDVSDAKLFIEEKLHEDLSLNVKVVYRLLKQGELVEKFDPIDSAMSGQSSQGSAKAVNFRPTPLDTSPRPPGSAPNWWKEDEEEK